MLLLADAALPALASGYELYAYEADRELTFTLVSFSDSVKPRELLTDSRPDARDGDQVRVHGSGLTVLRSTLARIPATASVILESDPRLPALSELHQAAVLSLLLARSAAGVEARPAAHEPAGLARPGAREPRTDAGAGAALCIGSGGKVDASYCCMSSTAFPDTCLVGACGCAPESSRLTPYCVCPDGFCFSATKGCTVR